MTLEQNVIMERLKPHLRRRDLYCDTMKGSVAASGIDAYNDIFEDKEAFHKLSKNDQNMIIDMLTGYKNHVNQLAIKYPKGPPVYMWYPGEDAIEVDELLTTDSTIRAMIDSAIPNITIDKWEIWTKNVINNNTIYVTNKQGIVSMIIMLFVIIFLTIVFAMLGMS